MQFNFLFSTVTDTLLRNLNFTGAVKGASDLGNFCSHNGVLICKFDGSGNSSDTYFNLLIQGSGCISKSSGTIHLF
jgi:hypothetical protein